MRHTMRRLRLLTVLLLSVLGLCPSHAQSLSATPLSVADTTKGVGHRLVAGRAVSSDHAANSALRVQASCMAMGQAAGVVAALAASKHCDPRQVPLALIRQCLSRIGHIVPVKE